MHLECEKCINSGNARRRGFTESRPGEFHSLSLVIFVRFSCRHILVITCVHSSFNKQLASPHHTPTPPFSHFHGSYLQSPSLQPALVLFKNPLISYFLVGLPLKYYRYLLPVLLTQSSRPEAPRAMGVGGMGQHSNVI